MPSDHMVRFPLDVYNSEGHLICSIIEEHNVPRTRFLRECIKLVIYNPKLITKAVNNCRGTDYAPRGGK